MNEATPTTLDDDRIAAAAQRVIDRFKLRQGSVADAPVGAKIVPRLNPDDPQSLRLAIDAMAETVARLERLQTLRDQAFTAALERVERTLAKAEGRVDALAVEVAAISDRPVMAQEAVRDSQNATLSAAKAEFTSMFELTRALLDEARQLHGEAVRKAAD